MLTGIDKIKRAMLPAKLPLSTTQEELVALVKKLYPEHSSLAQARREAYASCAIGYIAQVKELQSQVKVLYEIRDGLWKCFEDEKNNHIHFARMSEDLSKRLSSFDDNYRRLLLQVELLEDSKTSEFETMANRLFALRKEGDKFLNTEFLKMH